MASPRRFPARSLTRSPRRSTSWGVGPNQEEQAQAAVGQTLWTNGVVLTTEDGATIVRIRGQLLLTLNLATAALDGMIGAIGIGIVNQQAFTIGSTAVPGPFSEPDWDGWMWHHYIHTRAIAAQAAGADIAINSQSSVQRLEIDTKAMRKFGNNEVLIGVTEVGREIGTSSISTSADTRVLLKLH